VFISNTLHCHLDDHEIANNSYTAGHKTTSPMKAITIFEGRGAPGVLRMVAYSRNNHLYRSFSFGPGDCSCSTNDSLPHQTGGQHSGSGVQQ